ncbi:MAG TPA: metallophosphoesterase, partial [Hyphomicrobiaceae bacterium]|nr:metallophosphoesterase [Hyphomicrobiaceae bacterium]
MTGTLRLAHLSDIHMPVEPEIELADLNLKRMLGRIGWRRQRRFIHSLDALERIVGDVAALRPDHIAVTGDLVNLGLGREIVAVRGLLARLGPPDRVSVIPGNHDLYTRRRPGEAGIDVWSDYMGMVEARDGLESASDPRALHLFPYVRRLGTVALVGVNSARPTRPISAMGGVGESQRRRLALTLDQLAAEGLTRVMMIHHPPLPGQTTALRGLDDDKEIEALLRRHGAELVLHGHNHRNMRAEVPGPRGPVPILAVPSASAGKVHGG